MSSAEYFQYYINIKIYFMEVYRFGQFKKKQLINCLVSAGYEWIVMVDGDIDGLYLACFTCI